MASHKYPTSATFGEPHAGATSARRAAPPSDYLLMNGFHYRIPPLYDQVREKSVLLSSPPFPRRSLLSSPRLSSAEAEG